MATKKKKGRKTPETVTRRILRKNNNNTYTDEYKEMLVKRLLAPGGPSANKLAAQTGVSQPTLSRWLRAYKKEKGIPTKKATAVPEAVQAALKDQDLMVLIVPRKDVEDGVLDLSKFQAAS